MNPTNPASPYSVSEALTSTQPTPRFGFAVKSGRYKSIPPPFEWRDIPPLAIISGLNGAGKTQLLEAIAMHYNPHLKNQLQGNQLVIETADHKYGAHDVFFIRRLSDAFAEDTVHPGRYHEMLNALRSQHQGDPYEVAIQQHAQNAPVEHFPLDALYVNVNRVERAIAYDFIGSMVDRANSLLASENLTTPWVPPWGELNLLLERWAFPYRFVPPREISLTEPLRLQLLSTETGENVLLRDLSSGEASIMRFLLFSFAARKMDGSPKLFLLDEPDSHLHASLIQSFIDVVQKILVKTFGFRVLASTHRTETLAFAPEGSLYEMRRTGVRIKRSDEKARTISMLTGSMISVVYGGKRPVFVEDQDDVVFYRTVVSILMRHDEWRWRIIPEFMPAAWFGALKSSQGQKPKGGKGNVKRIVQEFNRLGFEDVISGLVDRDDDDQVSTSNIFQLERYSIENYLLDPLYIYVYLMQHGCVLPVDLEQQVRLGAAT